MGPVAGARGNEERCQRCAISQSSAASRFLSSSALGYVRKIPLTNTWFCPGCTETKPSVATIPMIEPYSRRLAHAVETATWGLNVKYTTSAAIATCRQTGDGDGT